MQVTQQSEKSQVWEHIATFGHGFVTLRWYDELIDFAFKFVAKTSEPLLAAGLVVSAADFLSDGQVMAHNPGLALIWSWMQAVAIETSAGVTLAYAFQSGKSNDKTKTIIYIVLASLLAFVGAIMLFLQLFSHALGRPETTFTTANAGVWLAASMAVLRSIVAVGYVVMCRVKHIRFSGTDESQDAQSAQVIEPQVPDIGKILASIEEHHQRQMQTTIEIVTRTVIQHMEQSFVTAPMRSVPLLAHQQEHKVQASGTNIQEVEIERNTGAFPSLPQSEMGSQGEAIEEQEPNATQRLESVWAGLSEQQRASITGNALYNLMGKGIRKERVYQFLTARQIEEGSQVQA